MRMHPYVGFGLCTDHICPDLFTIEDYATIGHRVMIIAHRNPGWSVEIKEKYAPPFVAPTTIGGDARVTTGSMALAAVTIGEVRVVGAVSAVKGDVEPHAVAAGNPASVVGRLERGTDTRSRIEPSNRPSRRVLCGQAS
jgi:acetyltransferase-like isoleucine patch superfamily enzyme